MNNQRMQVIGFYTLLGLALLIVGLMWLPFLKLLALGAILAVLFLPVHDRLVKKTKRETLAAWLTIIIILLIVMIPLYLVAQVLFNELVSLYGQFKSGNITFNQAAILNHLPEQLRTIAANILGGLSQKISGLTSNIFTGITGIISNVAGFALSFVLVFFTIFYLLKDGRDIKKYFNSVFPLSETHENLLVAKLEEAVSGVVKGSFLVALIQGTVATVGFLVFGVPQPFLWGAFTVLAALVPNVGTSLSVIPAVIYLFLTGHTGAGVGMAIWGTAAVGTIDNFVSPRLVGSRTKLHPLLVLFSVIGGIQLFGYIGFLLGPILMAVLVTLLDIYRTDLKSYMEK